MNEISKALEVLGESRRAHWAIAPETVYQNCYQNYLVYDSFFVVGFDTQSNICLRVEVS